MRKPRWIFLVLASGILGATGVAWAKSRVNSPDPGTAGLSGQPVAFGHKCAWLAVHNVEPERVVHALGLQHPRAAGWPEGTGNGCDPASRSVFVTPRVDGWVLAIGATLPRVGGPAGDQLTSWLVTLSHDLGTTVQYFATDQVIDYHAWAWADDGTLHRAYGYFGEVVLNKGDLTEEERTLGLIYQTKKVQHTQEADVLALAGKWSLNPTQLEMHTPVGPGWLGQFTPH